MWDRVASTRAVWLASSDAEALRALCDLWQLRMQVLPELLESPADKNLRIAFNNYTRQFLTLAAKFGLTPSDRARLGEEAEEPQQNAELEAMLR